ncbi:hypothetical protein R3P38DRAFT_3113814 [Favolaschia claudopus]|uniref:F-box domain-containing protein n=1 Tax=Favolaschia claudopus TaxID=2862362 RepID=A0AAV9ZHN6_9AGAR
MSRPSPLDIQELVDHCIDCLAGSPYDLLSCALVARAWVDGAQSHLLRRPHSTNRHVEHAWDGSRIPEFYDTLVRYPHLARHVDDLWVVASRAEKLCHLNFTRLKCLSVVSHDPLPEAFRHLLSLPTLHHLEFTTFNRLEPAFPPPWKYCSTTIQHLTLFCVDLSGLTHAFPIIPGIQHIRLKSLWLDVDVGSETLNDLALFPFDVSAIQALGITTRISVPQVPFSTWTVQVLVLYLTRGDDNDIHNLDLSSFPNLALLRICLRSSLPPSLLTTLATIVPSQRIDTIALSFRDVLNPATPTDLDLVLSSLPLSPPPSFELVRADDQINLKLAFPTLFSKHLVRVSSRDDPGASAFWTEEKLWWQRVVDKL